jgi:hypothetical protein
MIAYPEIQKKCQEELDAVVGRERMPTFQDMENLPYLRATVREALRWRPVTPLGMLFEWQFGWIHFIDSNFAGVHHYVTQVNTRSVRPSAE